MTSQFVLEEAAPTSAVFRSGARLLRIVFVAEKIARVTLTEHDSFSQQPSEIVTAERVGVPVRITEEDEIYRVSTASASMLLNRRTGSLQFVNRKGQTLFRQPERGGLWLVRKAVSRAVFAAETHIETGQSIDGARAAAVPGTTVFDREAFEAKLEFACEDDEALFGFGSHEEGYANLRGRSRELYQQNMKAVVPVLVSSRGYAVLFDCGSLMTFHDDALGTYWWADCVDELDFYIIGVGDFDSVIAGYRHLTGTPPLPPKWAFGYVQSKERYVTAEEMLEVVREYRRRQIPLDLIVLDWKSWPNGSGWGQKSFDPQRFPDPRRFVEELHALNVRLMVSIWPIMTGGCENQRELLDAGLMLGNKSTYNAFVPEARDMYWQQVQRGLGEFGVDAWWCDCTEPFEADWSGAVKPEPHKRLLLNAGESQLYLDPAQINTYSLLHSRGIYEGQRRAFPNRRVLNLTRSSYAGQSRYGTFSWNGDICATWDTLRRTIAEGVHFCATGEAYWTCDVGGFFVDHREDLWFWRGDYPARCRGLTPMEALAPDPADTGSKDLGYWELYTRWMQYAVFLPMMRSHGTDVAREIWCFGEPGSAFYDAIAAAIRLRYALLPYVYSTAASATFAHGSMLRALGLAFPQDTKTHSIGDEFLFGTCLLVCPVTQPMYFGPGSRAIENASRTRDCYLPEGTRWYCWHTNKPYGGGQLVSVESPLARIPVFARAGAIVPLGAAMQYVEELPGAPYTIRVYTGADGIFRLYEDAGDGYAYERGECAWVELRWSEDAQELTFLQRQGTFFGMCVSRRFHVRFITRDGTQEQTLDYTGEPITLRMRTGVEQA